MRFPILTKATLLAAGLFVATAALSHAQTITSTQATGIEIDGSCTIDTSNGGFTVGGIVSGDGTIYVQGGNPVQLDVFGGYHWINSKLGSGSYPWEFPNVVDYVKNEEGEGGNGGDENAFAPEVTEPNPELPWGNGGLVIREGDVKLKGALNLPLNYGRTFHALMEDFPAEGKMAGVDFIRLEGTSKLYVGESIFDKNESLVPSLQYGMFWTPSGMSKTDNVFVFLNNLQAGTDNSQVYTTLDVGADNSAAAKAVRYHVDLHVDAWDGVAGSTETLENGGSIGMLSGNASVYKTGDGDFKLLGASSSFTGYFYAAGGNLLLNAPETSALTVDVTGVLKANGYDLEYGHTLWASKSLTIAGTIDPQSEAVGSVTSSFSEASRFGALSKPLSATFSQAVDGGQYYKQTSFYKSAYFSTPSAGTVVVTNNQAIRNFQAMFANGVAATDSNKSAASAVQNAADREDFDAPIIAGTGAGSYLAVKEGSTLAIYQEEGMGGIYKGTICGVNEEGTAAGIDSQTGELERGGTIVKYGKGDLALSLEGANYEKLVILEGENIYVNVVTLDLDIGSYDWGTKAWIRDTGLFVGKNVGNFTIVENDAATLAMRLNTENIHFSTYAYVNTAGGEIDFSDERKPGYIELSTEQRFITGEVFVENGMTLITTAEDFIGTDVDTDGDTVADRRNYSDINGSGTYKIGETEYAVSYYKDLATGNRVYYYTDADGKEVELTSEQVNSTAFSFTDYVEFSGGSIANASAVILAGKGKTEAVRSTLAFNNTNQKVNNLTGDEWSEVRLGRSTLTVNITDAETISGVTNSGSGLRYSTYSGAISGVGNIIKTGNTKWTLGGGSSLSYMGATVVAGGSIEATKSQSLWNSSAILMNAGTGIQFSGAQNLVSLIGGSADVSLNTGGYWESVVGDDGVTTTNFVPATSSELRLGMDASRRSDLNDVYSVTNGILGGIVTDELGNSTKVLNVYSGKTALVEAYLKPILDFTEKTVSYTDANGKIQTREVLSRDQAKALTQYFQRETPNDEAMQSLFGRSVTTKDPLTVADITRLYARLTAETQFGATFDKEGNLASADLNEMLDRLSFNGTLTANSLVKIGDDRATLAGTVNVKSASILAGTLEIDADAVGRVVTLTEGGSVGEVIQSEEPAFSDGVTVAAGATFAINTSGIQGDYSFDKSVSGDGNFEKLGEGHLILSENVAYLGDTTLAGGDLTMTLRSVDDKAYEQGDISVKKSSSTLTLAQSEGDVVWTGTLNNAGSLVKTGAGTLSLTNAATIGKNLVVDAGMLTLADAEISDYVPAKDETPAKVSVAEGATLRLSESNVATVDRAFEGKGTFVKSGDGELILKTTNAGKAEDKFSGAINVEAGTLVWDTEAMFADGVSVNVAKDATLRANESQTVKMLSGDGDVLISTEKAVTLGITLANGNKLSYDNSGVYVATVNGESGTDYSAFDVYTGAFRTVGDQATSAIEFGGNGSLVFAGSILSEHLALSIAGASTVITSVTDLQVDVSGTGRIILASGSNEVLFNGEISGEEGRTIGKIGSGKVTLGSGNAKTWAGAKLEVLEGTLLLEGRNAFSFDSAVVVKDATLALAYTKDSVVNLSAVEGSGTIRLVMDSNLGGNTVLNLTASSMLAPLPNAEGKYFNGILDAGILEINVNVPGVTLCSIETQGGFYSEEKVAIYQASDTTIAGAFSGNIELTGSGRLTLTDENATGTILVNNGNVEISATAGDLDNNDVVGGIRVKNNATIYFNNTSSVKETLSFAEVRLAQGENVSVGRVELVKTGDDTKTLDFTGEQDGGRFTLGVSEELWVKFTESGNGNARLVLGVDRGKLELSGLEDLSEAVGLSTSSAGTLVISAAQAPETLDRSISGNGNVAFAGASGTSVTANQAYTGTTTIEAGATVAFSNVELATSTLFVEGVQKGGIKLVGAKAESVAKARSVASASSGVVGGNFVNNGTVILDVNNGDIIEYAGTFANTGTIEIKGASATTRGHEIVLFKSLSGITYTTKEMELLFGNGKLTNGSTDLMIVQTNGLISAFSVGSSFAETSGLRDGLAGSFTDVLDIMAGVDDAQDGIVFEEDLLKNWGEIGVALNRASADSLAADVANLSPIGMASMVAMSRSSFANDWNALTSRMSHRRYDSGNTLMENGPEFFARAQATLVENADNSDSANYDFNTYGAIVGMDVKPNDHSVYGAALGYDYGSAKIHDNGGDIHSDSFRAMLFASTLIGDESYFLDGALYFSLDDYEVERETLVGSTKGDTEGWNVGASATFGKGFLLSKDTHSRLLATPYIGVSYQYSRVNAFGESGTAALDVDKFDAHSLLGRLGATLDWQFPLGDYEARVSFDVAYSHEFMDDEAEIDAAFVSDGEKFRVDGTIGSSDVFSFSPSMTIDLSERNSVFFGYSLEYGTNEQIGHSVSAGFRHCF